MVAFGPQEVFERWLLDMVAFAFREVLERWLLDMVAFSFRETTASGSREIFEGRLLTRATDGVKSAATYSAQPVEWLRETLVARLVTPVVRPADP
jgi:hypothetical protein